MNSKQYSFIFLILQIFLILKCYYLDDYFLLFYFCYHIPLFIFLGLYFDNNLIIKTIINIGLIAQLEWIIDFISILIGKPIIGNTIFIFYYPGCIFIVTLLSHFSCLFLIFITNKKLPKETILISFCYILIIYNLALLFVPENYNINWLYNSYGILNLKIYTLIYPIFAFIYLILNYYLQKLIYKKNS
jgi:hypothetical protein